MAISTITIAEIRDFGTLEMESINPWGMAGGLIAAGLLRPLAQAGAAVNRK